MRLLLASFIAATAIAAVPATAATNDAFSSFTGTNTGGAFTYGSSNETGSVFTPFSDAAGCAALISNVICTSDGNLPAAFKSTSGAHQSGTVIVPGNALILHPGPLAGQAAAVLFNPRVDRAYAVTLSAFVADTNPSGVRILLIAPSANLIFPLATLTAANPTFTTTASSLLVEAGIPFGIAVDFNGSYYNDSTGINFAVTPFALSVPEPATWALMIAGFAMVGVAARRRHKVATA